MRIRFVDSVLVAVSLSGCSGLAGIDQSMPSSTMFKPVSAVSSPTQKRELLSAATSVPNGSGAIYEPASDAGPVPSDTQNDQGLSQVHITLSFVDADVREFARVFFSEMLHRPYSVDPNLAGTVTLRSGGPIDGNKALDLARQALEASGNTVVVSSGLYRVTNIANRQPDASGNVKTFSLRYISGSAAEQALTPLLNGRAQVLNVTSSSLGVRGDPDSVDLAGSMLATIDVDRFKESSFGLFPLKNADPGIVVDELERLYNAVGVVGETLIPVDRMNAVLVVTDKAGQLDFARKWIDRLDHATGGDQRQVYVYQVKNREAEDLAKLVSEVFSNAGAGSVAAPVVASAADAGVGQVQGASASMADTMSVTADPATNSLVIRASGDEYDLVQKALLRLDTPLEQVYVEATIAEVRLGGELSHGVRWFLQSGNFSSGISDATNGAVAPQYPGFNFAFKVPQAQVVISALESYTDVRIVSSPQLTVVDHQTATIQVGDQVPIVTKSVQDTSSGTNVIASDVSMRDTGVILKVTPSIRSSGEVLLNIEQEVSRVLPTTSSQLNSPTISQRKVQSTVLVPDGTAIVLGGLMSATDESSQGGLPGTQKTLLESLFGSKDTKTSRSELIVIIRPVVIRSGNDLKAVVKEISEKMGNLSLPQ